MSIEAARARAFGCDPAGTESAVPDGMDALLARVLDGEDVSDRIAAMPEAEAAELRGIIGGLAALGLADPAAEWPAAPFAASGDGHPTEVPAGSNLGGARVLNPIARGSRSLVLAAEHAKSGARIAIKVPAVRDAPSFAAAAERYRRQHESWQRSPVAGCCPVLASGSADGVPFLQLELLPGRGLQAWLASRRAGGGLPDRDETVSLIGHFAGVAATLQRLHDGGCVHGGLAPSRMVVAAAREPVLLGMGSGGASRGDAPALRAYRAPEQVLARAPAPDPRTDVFSLGVVIYECLTLAHPFAASAPEETSEAILTRAVPPPRSRNPRLPARLDEAVMRALSRDREDRWPSAAAFAAALRPERRRSSIFARAFGFARA